MTTSSDTRELTLRRLYPRLLAANQDAFGGEEYDVAYHALMAALYVAQALKDTSALAEVARVAEEQLAQIDSEHPEYSHSTPSAAKRGLVSIYTLCARHADARIRLLETEANQCPKPFQPRRWCRQRRLSAAWVGDVIQSTTGAP